MPGEINAPRVDRPYYTRESKEAKFHYDCTVHGSSRGRLANTLFVNRNFVVALIFRKALIFLGAAALGTDNGGTLVEQRIFNALAMFGKGIRWYSIG